MEQKIKLETIEKLVLSSNEDDVILGITLLIKRYEKSRKHVTRFLNSVYIYNFLGTLDIYTDWKNFFFNDGTLHLYSVKSKPIKGEDSKVVYI